MKFEEINLNPSILKIDCDEQILCIQELREYQNDILVITEKQIKIISNDL